MNLHKMLAARAEAGNPVRVGLIGAGKFGAMFLAQARLTRGLRALDRLAEQLAERKALLERLDRDDGGSARRCFDGRRAQTGTDVEDPLSRLRIDEIDHGGVDLGSPHPRQPAQITQRATHTTIGVVPVIIRVTRSIVA